MWSPKVFKTITWLLLSRFQGNKPHRNSPQPSEPCLRNLHQHAPELFGGSLRNLHQHAPELSRTLRLPEPTFRNLPEPSGTYLLNLRQHTPEPSKIFRNLPPEPTPFYTGTFRNLPPEPTPAHAGTLRNLPEPSSGTCSCDPHRHTPELIWAEDPISLRCWGKTSHLAIWEAATVEAAVEAAAEAVEGLGAASPANSARLHSQPINTTST